MTTLELFKELIGATTVSDSALQFYLDSASEIICDIRNSDAVESKYKNVQLRIAVELFSKRGAEGQVGHSENGISRSYEKSDVSESLIVLITPRLTTPFSKVREV